MSWGSSYDKYNDLGHETARARADADTAAQRARDRDNAEIACHRAKDTRKPSRSPLFGGIWEPRSSHRGGKHRFVRPAAIRASVCLIVGHFSHEL